MDRVTARRTRGRRRPPSTPSPTSASVAPADRGERLAFAVLAVFFVVVVGRLLGAGADVSALVDDVPRTRRFAGLAVQGVVAAMALIALVRARRPSWLDPSQHLARTVFVAVAMPCFWLYLLNGDVNFAGDVTFTGMIPGRLVRGEGLAFDGRFVATHDPWGLLSVGPDRWAPLWPVGPALWGVPAALFQRLAAVPPGHVADMLGQRVTACALAAAADALLFAALWVRHRRADLAALVTAGFAFGTPQASVCALAISQHTPAVMLVAAAVLCVALGERRGGAAWLARAGLPVGLIAAMRPQAAPVGAGLALAVALVRWRSLPRFALWTLPGIALYAGLNRALFGNVLGGYAQFAGGTHFTTPWIDGLAGLLVSPNRGLAAYAPVTLLALPGIVVAVRRRSRVDLAMLAGAVGLLLLHARWDVWWGGWCLPPRFLCEALPALMMLGGAFLAAVPSVAVRRGTTALTALSVLVTLPLLFFNDASVQWNAFPDVDLRTRDRIWDARDWAPMHFMQTVRWRLGRDANAHAFANLAAARAVRGTTVPWRAEVELATVRTQRALLLPPKDLAAGPAELVLRGAVTGASAASLDVAAYATDTNTALGRAHAGLGAGEAFAVHVPVVVAVSGVQRLDVRLLGAGTVALDTVRLR